MVPLLSKIAWELCERVMRVIDVRALFHGPLGDGKKRALEAAAMMDLWESAYLETGLKYSGQGLLRFEFDRQVLFEKTTHISRVCKDLASVAQVGFCNQRIKRSS
jgi:dynein heavy chain